MAMLKVFDHDPAAQAELRDAGSAEPYDEVLRLLARKGHAVPASLLERDVTLPHQRSAALVPVFKRIYENSHEFWAEYHLCRTTRRRRGDVPALAFPPHEDGRTHHRFPPRHGGSSGVSFLKRALDLTFFRSSSTCAPRSAFHPAAHRERAPLRCGLTRARQLHVFRSSSQIQGFSMSTTNATTAAPPEFPQMLGHPRPLWMLFMTEFWSASRSTASAGR
jgi:hypothetical protein